MKCEVKLISSLEKVLFNQFYDLPEYNFGSMLKNEIYAFQLALWGEHEQFSKFDCKLKIESELEPYMKVKQVVYVPSMLPIDEHLYDDDYIIKTPGLLPDPLHTIKNGEITAVHHQTRSLWIVVEPNGEKLGTHPIVFRVFDTEDNLMAETCFTLEIIDAELPEMNIVNTGWFHGDCIAKLHNVEILSDEYFEIIEKYLNVYVKFGHNTILTPVFTPPLDTEVGAERPTNQLVEVMIHDGEYSFRFDNLKRWIDLCHKCGIKYFEIAHFFTQWGAYHAPKIMALVDGEYKKIFGWETEALSEEYKSFLNHFLPKLTDFLRQEGVMQNCFFHVSDEPGVKHEEQYKNVKQILLSYIDGSQMIDAITDYSFYEKGIISKPVVCNDHIHTFMEHGVKDLWTYYCTAQGKDVANRFMAMPSYRNRILGYQLYKYDIKGFLQWGFNFWFSKCSRNVLNPYLDTTADEAFQSGDAFLVYPLDADGEVVCSLRLYVFNEGLQDMRALKLLESLSNKQTVHEMLEDIDGFTSYPRNSQFILQVREQINQKIKQIIVRD